MFFFQSEKVEDDLDETEIVSSEDLEKLQAMNTDYKDELLIKVLNQMNFKFW